VPDSTSLKFIVAGRITSRSHATYDGTKLVRGSIPASTGDSNWTSACSGWLAARSSNCGSQDNLVAGTSWTLANALIQRILPFVALCSVTMRQVATARIGRPSRRPGD
jgi:hypothetical protein